MPCGSFLLFLVPCFLASVYHLPSSYSSCARIMILVIACAGLPFSRVPLAGGQWGGERYRRLLLSAATIPNHIRQFPDPHAVHPDGNRSNLHSPVHIWWSPSLALMLDSWRPALHKAVEDCPWSVHSRSLKRRPTYRCPPCSSPCFVLFPCCDSGGALHRTRRVRRCSGEFCRYPMSLCLCLTSRL